MWSLHPLRYPPLFSFFFNNFFMAKIKNAKNQEKKVQSKYLAPGYIITVFFGVQVQRYISVHTLM